VGSERVKELWVMTVVNQRKTMWQVQYIRRSIRDRERDRTKLTDRHVEGADSRDKAGYIMISNAT